MPIPVVCGSCNSKLVAPDAAAGKKVKCKNCQAVLPVPAPEEHGGDFEIVDPAPVIPAKPVAAKPIAAAPTKAKSQADFAVDDDDVEIPQPKKKSKPAVVVDDDEEEDVAPKRSKKKNTPAVIVDEDEDPRPKKKKGKNAKKKLNPLIFILGGGGALLLLAILGVLIWFVAFRGKTETAPTIANNPGSVAPADPLAGWTKFVEPAYTVYFKDSYGTPESKSQTQAGVKTNGMVVGNGPGSNSGLLVFITEFPANVFNESKKKPAVAFDAGEKSFTGKGKILTRKDITVDGNPGREVKIQGDGTQLLLRIVLAHNRVYVYGIVDTNVSETSETYRIFFENFKMKA